MGGLVGAVVVGMLVSGCASTAANAPARVWVERSDELPADAAPFAMAARGDWLLRTPLGSWNEPLDVRGVVLSAGKRRNAMPIALRAPSFRATHLLALRVGDERVELQYDSPAGDAPVQPGEQVRVVAHSMSEGMRLAFSMAVLGRDGTPRLIGVRAQYPDAMRLPAGWSIAEGPEIQWACGRGLIVRGPGGEIVAEPGRTAVAALGPAGERYAVSVTVDRPDHAQCTDPGQLSVVVRRLGDPVAAGSEPRLGRHGSRASL